MSSDEATGDKATVRHLCEAVKTGDAERTRRVSRYPTRYPMSTNESRQP